MTTYGTDDADMPELCEYREVGLETAREFLKRRISPLSRLRNEETTHHVWTTRCSRAAAPCD